MKGQISMIESIIAIIVLLIAFNMMIPNQVFENKWKDAIFAIQGRDILLTSDRIGKLYEHSFSQTSFQNFINNIESIRDSIVNIDTQGAVKSKIYVACDCTSEQLNYLQNILSDVKFNERSVTAVVCSTSLPKINSCDSELQYPDILIIFGYKNLNPYLEDLINFIENGGSVIEIADISQGQITVDNAQSRIFGIKWFDTDNRFEEGLNEFLKPRNASQITYQAYKWFYHLPYTLTSQPTNSIPVENGISECNSATKRNGTFKFQNIERSFWICGKDSVYFDTDTPPDNSADTIVQERENFVINNYNFFLNYIDNEKIRISFKPDYKFVDFLVKRQDQGHNKLFPIDNQKERILLHLGFWDITREQPRAAIIINGTTRPTAIWIADFSRDGLENTGDDHKQLLASLIFSSVNKEIRETFSTVGKITSYINTKNFDIFEVYKIVLEVGLPF